MASLCGLCNQPGRQSFHTCSVDLQTFYCVWCIWKKVELLGLRAKPISVSRLQPFHTIEWDGIYATEIIAMRAGDHWTRIKNADLSYPIIVMEYRGQLEVVDGAHRLSKIHLQKQESAMCIEVTPGQLLDCRMYFCAVTI